MAIPSLLVRIDHAALNYRDFIVASGMFGAVPANHVPGSEGAGVVLSSDDPGFREGDRVFVNGHGLGESLAGTTAGDVRVPLTAACMIPDALTSFQAATVGVAGLVAQAAREACAPASGAVVAVTGAMGGTGRVAAALYARSGLSVQALTRNPEAAGVLADLGVARIRKVPDPADLAADAFGPETFDAAFDVTAGLLNWLTRQMKPGGTIALAGFTGGHRAQLNAIAVILRRLRVLGVNAALSPEAKARAFQTISRTLGAEDYGRIAHVIPPQAVPEALKAFATGPGRGRVVVALR